MTTNTETPTARLGEITIPLAAPASMASRYDVLAAAGTNLSRAACAALAMAWQGPGKPKTRKSHDILDYGGRVMDELCERGHAPILVMAAGISAYHVVTAGLITDSEVDEVEGNSEAPGESTST